MAGKICVFILLSFTASFIINSQLSEAGTEKCSWDASTSAVLTYYAGVVYDPCMMSVLLGDTEAEIEERKADVKAKQDKHQKQGKN